MAMTNRNRLPLGLIAFVFASAFLSAPLPAQSLPGPQSPAECAVLSAVLDASGGPATSVNVASLTVPDIRFGTRGSVVRSAFARLSPPDSALIASYFTRNQTSEPLRADCFQTRRSVVLVAKEERDTSSQALVSLSNAGFSPEGNRAVVHRIYECGERCGYGDLFILENKAGRWSIESVIRTITF